LIRAARPALPSCTTLPNSPPCEHTLRAPRIGQHWNNSLTAARRPNGEIRLLLDIHPKMEACRQQLLDRLTLSTPSFAAILATLFAKADDSFIELIGKNQSWGEHTRQSRDLAIEARSELTAEAERITSGLQQSHEAELARRQAAAQAAADAFARYAQTQQIISSMNRPVNCITMNMGSGFSNTSCQ
jgi:hypothetical protein